MMEEDPQDCPSLASESSFLGDVNEFQAQQVQTQPRKTQTRINAASPIFRARPVLPKPEARGFVDFWKRYMDAGILAEPKKKNDPPVVSSDEEEDGGSSGFSSSSGSFLDDAGWCNYHFGHIPGETVSASDKNFAYDHDDECACGMEMVRLEGISVVSDADRELRKENRRRSTRIRDEDSLNTGDSLKDLEEDTDSEGEIKRRDSGVRTIGSTGNRSTMTLSDSTIYTAPSDMAKVVIEGNPALPYSEESPQTPRIPFAAHRLNNFIETCGLDREAVVGMTAKITAARARKAESASNDDLLQSF